MCLFFLQKFIKMIFPTYEKVVISMQVTFIMKLFDIYSTIGLKTFRNSQTPLEFVKILSIFI